MQPTPKELEDLQKKNLNFVIETAAIYRFSETLYKGFSNSISKDFPSYEEGIEFYRSLGYQKGKILIGEWI